LIDFPLRFSVRTLVSCVLLSVSLLSAAYARDFPPLAKVGSLKGFERPFVKIGDTTFRLAPGARIRDEKSRIILPATLLSGIKVVYKLEAQTGFLYELWLLAPGEIVTIQQ
jgi:hypothetical protein